MTDNVAYDRQDRLLSDLADAFVEICQLNGLSPDIKKHLMSRFEDFLFTTTDFESWRELKDGEMVHDIENMRFDIMKSHDYCAIGISIYNAVDVISYVSGMEKKAAFVILEEMRIGEDRSLPDGCLVKRVDGFDQED